MKANLLTAKYLKNEDAARAFIERIRWPHGPVCPHCAATKIYRLAVKSTQRKVLKCATCRRQFSVTVGTIFEDSHIPLTTWIGAMLLLCSSKKGMSAHQLHRMMGITYKSAWFMAHRIRHAMQENTFPDKLGGIVEADETYVGGKKKGGSLKEAWQAKSPVFSLLQRGGRVRSFAMPRVTGKNLKQIIRENVDKSATIMTDSFIGYRGLKYDFAGHEMVDHHREEYVRGNAYTNTVENYFSILKRGIIGTYQHVGSQHLHRYMAEFDFRYNHRGVEDVLRTMEVTRGMVGKRLQYR
jgi:transposase-like protein